MVIVLAMQQLHRDTGTSTLMPPIKTQAEPAICKVRA